MSEPAASVLTVDPIEGGYRVSGQVDLSTIERFREAVAGANEGTSDLVLDLSGCTYMGSEGVGVLIELAQALDAGRLVLRQPDGIVGKVLDLAGLAKLPNVEISAG